jgi:hypothetical protein
LWLDSENNDATTWAAAHCLSWKDSWALPMKKRYRQTHCPKLEFGVFATSALILGTCRGGTITFSDQDGGSGPMERGLSTANANVFGAAQGLPTGIIATFDGFNRYGAADANHKNPSDILNYDHTGGTDWRAIYGVNDTASLVFNKPVQINSFWFDNFVNNWPPDPSMGDPGYIVQVIGLSNGIQMWTYTYPWPTLPGGGYYDDSGNYISINAFQEITAGSGLQVDQLLFNNVMDVAIDDLTINSVPEPSFISTIILLGSGFLVGGSRRLYRTN